MNEKELEEFANYWFYFGSVHGVVNGLLGRKPKFTEAWEEFKENNKDNKKLFNVEITTTKHYIVAMSDRYGSELDEHVLECDVIHSSFGEGSIKKVSEISPDGVTVTDYYEDVEGESEFYKFDELTEPLLNELSQVVNDFEQIQVG